MLSNNLALYGAKIFYELLRDFFLFPVLWYSQGLFYFVKKLLMFLLDMQKSLALWIWIKNIHKPMYQQTDWQGYMISILMRIFQIIVRAIAMLFWLALCLVLLFAWVALPFYIVYQLYFQVLY